MTARPGAPGWHGVHLHYAADRDLVLREWVRPVATSLLAEGTARRFFFIRYLLGGPHVRFRVEADDADAPAAVARMHAAAAELLERAPSPEPHPPERIHARNRGIIASDPFADETDDVVIADNTVHDRPVHVEVDRYGGPALVDHALDLFAVSSMETLRLVDAHAGEPAGRRTAAHMRLLLRQAWGHAADGDELLRLADYGGEMFGRPLAKLLPVADAAFERGRAGTCALVRAELAVLAGGDAAPTMAEAAAALRAELGGVPADRRHGMGVAHLHMTANRLGLMNPDEVYLCRMLSRAVQAVAEEEPGLWRDAWDAHAAWTPAPLREQTAALLADLAGQAVLATA